MALGELSLKPDEFWVLTNGELMAMVRGFVVRRDIESANHRNLFTLMYNVNRGKNTSPKQASEVWPLMMDDSDKMEIDDRLEFYKKVGKNINNG